MSLTFAMLVLTTIAMAAARQFTTSIDAHDVDAMVSMLADDVEGVEEISRQWLHGRDTVAEYIRELPIRIRNLRTELGDVNERVWGDIGVVTCWLDQTYTYEDTPARISRSLQPSSSDPDAGEWKVVLHSAPLPE